MWLLASAFICFVLFSLLYVSLICNRCSSCFSYAMLCLLHLLSFMLAFVGIFPALLFITASASQCSSSCRQSCWLMLTNRTMTTRYVAARCQSRGDALVFLLLAVYFVKSAQTILWRRHDGLTLICPLSLLIYFISLSLSYFALGWWVILFAYFLKGPQLVALTRYRCLPYYLPQ